MKVLLVADNLGGVWTYALELARALALHDVEVSLAVIGRALDDDERAQLAQAPLASSAALEAKLEWMDDPWDDVERSGAWLLELAEGVRPDVVHLNGYAHASLPWRSPVLVVAHSDVLSWWSAVRGGDAPREWERYRQEVERGLRAAAAVVAPTRAMLAALERHYDFDTERHVIPNGRRLDVLPHTKGPFVITAGRIWDEAKNVAALGRIAPRLPWPVLVAGDGQAENVFALGRLPSHELVAHLLFASVFAAPARYEPFGLGAVEAALCGCALVLGDIESQRELWAGAAAFVDPEDDEAIAATLLRLIDDEAERRDHAERARQRAVEYTPERMAVGYLELYERLRVGVAA